MPLLQPPPLSRRLPPSRLARVMPTTLIATGLSLAASGAGRLVSHEVVSPYQAGPQQIRVLLPDHYDAAGHYPVVYLLPTDSGQTGAPIELAAELDVPNRHNVIVVTASFSTTPWYGDHPSDPATRQESHLIDFVVPFVESHYATLVKPAGRLLLGFSKSGWGAISLILRHPDFFGFAAAWDSPFMMTELRFESAKVFVTRELLNKYRPDLLLPVQGSHFRDRTRLVIAGEDKFGPLAAVTHSGSATTDMHALLEREGVRHIYRPDLHVKHAWDKAWLGPLFDELVALAHAQPGAPS